MDDPYSHPSAFALNWQGLQHLQSLDPMSLAALCGGRAHMTMVAVQQLLREGDLQVGNLADKLGPIARVLPSTHKNHLSVLRPVTPLRATQPYPRAVLRRTKGRLYFFGRRRLSKAVDSFVTPLVSAGLVHRPKRLRIRGIGDCRDPQLTKAGMQARDALRNQLASGGGYQALAERAGDWEKDVLAAVYGERFVRSLDPHLWGSITVTFGGVPARGPFGFGRDWDWDVTDLLDFWP